MSNHDYKTNDYLGFGKVLSSIFAFLLLFDVQNFDHPEIIVFGIKCHDLKDGPENSWLGYYSLKEMKAEIGRYYCSVALISS